MNDSIKHNHMVLLAAAAETAAGTLSGTIFRKQIVRFGKWVNPLFPVEQMVLDEKWAQEIVDNFNAKVIDRVPVPLDHTDQVDRNAGEVVRLEIIKGDGLYAYMDIRRPETVLEIEDGLIFDVSVSFDWNYQDTKDGTEHGATLFHVALVNNPYLKGMKPFEKVVEQFNSRLSEALALSSSSSAIMLSEAKAKELQAMETATVKNEREFDIEITVTNDEGDAVPHTLKAGEEVDVPKDQLEAVTKQVTEAVEPGSEDGGEGDSAAGDDKGEDDKGEAGDGDSEDEDDKGDADKTAAEELSEARRELARYKLSEKYNELLEAGKITPAQKDKFLELSEVSTTTVSLSDKQVSLSEIVSGILEAGPQVLKFSEEGSEKTGDEDEDDKDKKPSEKLSDAERAGMKAVGADEAKFDELSAKYPEMKVTNGKEK